ncbi:MAG: glycosyltransferase family 2 protein [Opitutaceae bacterium]
MSRGAIIIPVYNRRITTLACLRHLRAMGDLEAFTIIVVDDGSTDGTAEAVRAEFPEIDILRGDGNLWWTGAITRGMSSAIAAGADAVCWLNDDCLPAEGTLRLLLDTAFTPPGQVVTAACYDKATGALVPNAFIGRERVEVTPETDQAAEGLSGFCVAMSVAVWSRIGPPDAAQFPHYYGDNAYTLRAARAGFRVRVLGAARAELIDHRELPTLAALRDPNASWLTNWCRMFVSPKSPYRLRTLFAFQRLKYGSMRGNANACARACHWFIKAYISGQR